jgi:hypothetical protein
VAIVGLTVFLLFPSGGAEPPTGTLCVASRADTPFRGQVIPPVSEVSSGGLQVKIDKRPALPWPQRESLKIEGLDIKERHLVAVLDAHGKPVESIWFRFYGSNHLCMSYDGYKGIGLDEQSIALGVDASTGTDIAQVPIYTVLVNMDFKFPSTRLYVHL